MRSTSRPSRGGELVEACDERLPIEKRKALPCALERIGAERGGERPGEVAGEEAGAGAGLARAGERGEAAVLGQRAPVAARSAGRGEGAEAKRPRRKSGHEMHEVSRAAAADERKVETGVLRLEVERAAHPPRLDAFEAFPSLGDRGSPGGIAALERETERVGLDEQAELVHLDRLGERDVGDPSPPLWVEDDEALTGERAYSLAQGSHADPPALGDQIEPQPFPRREFARDDRSPQPTFRPLGSAPRLGVLDDVEVSGGAPERDDRA